MSARRVWAFSPNSGGKKIPDLVRIDVEKRINDVAEQQLKETFIRLDLRFKGQFCYIDAFTKPGMRKSCRKQGKSVLKDCETLQFIYAGFDTLIRINGAFLTITTAMKSMSWLLILTVNSLENLKTHFWLLLRFIDIV
jgi:hypothetical protein